MAYSSISADNNLTNYSSSYVFRFRVAVHTLGVQYADAKSENHLSIYLLLGEDRSVHLDMRPSGNDEWPLVGKLHIRGHTYQMSDTVLEYADLDAIGCPTSFRPHMIARATRSSRTVADFVQACVRNSFNHFRFLSADDHPVGCRSWVYV